MDQLADDYAGRRKVAKVDIGENPDVPNRFQGRGIPTLMLFRDGRLIATKAATLKPGTPA